MAAHQSSAIADDPINVLFVLHNKFDLMDFAGPCEVFTTAQHDPKDPSTKAFEITLCGPEEKVLSSQGVIVESQITYEEAHEDLKDYSIMVILGGNSEETLKGSGATLVKEGTEPFSLIQAFAKLQESDPTQERTLMSVCTGSLFLARAGILAGLSCTTHPLHITKLEIICSQSTKLTMDEPPNVLEDSRYVVNNLRFDVNEDDDPYVRRKSDAGRRPSSARKGSISRKNSISAENIKRREDMPLGGLRVITSAGVTAGIDAALYMVSAMVSNEAAEHTTKLLDHDWIKGTVVDGVDV